MDLHDQRRLWAQSVPEVFDVGPIGGADLNESAAGAVHDLRYPERAADLDKLPARHRHLAAERQRVENQHDGRRVVVDDGRRLRPGEAQERVLEMSVTVAAPAAIKIILEVARAARHVRNRGYRLIGQHRAAEVRVNDGARQVDHAAQRRHRAPLEDVRGGPEHLRLARSDPLPGEHVFAQDMKRTTHRLCHVGSTIGHDKTIRRVRSKDAVDGREPHAGGSDLLSVHHSNLSFGNWRAKVAEGLRGTIRSHRPRAGQFPGLNSSTPIQ